MNLLRNAGPTNYIVYFIIYLLFINLIGILLMYVDKRKAMYGRWRIPEKTLIIIALLGGSIGCMVGMKLFRHKTQKIKFVLGYPTILIAELILIIYFLVRY